MTTPIQFTEKNLISDLRSGSGYAIGEMYYTSDPGQEGFWRFIGTDTSTLDDTGLTLTAPFCDSSITGVTNRGIFKRIYDGYICVDWFGAKGDGNTDNTAAIQLAVNTLSKYGFSGGTLFFGNGVYLTRTIEINSSQLTNWDKINIRGAGKMSTIIKGYPRLDGIGYKKTVATTGTWIANPLTPVQIPILKLNTQNVDSATAYLNISDLSIIGNYENGYYYHEDNPEFIVEIDTEYEYNGIEAYHQTYFELGNIEIKGCEICFIGEGCLSFNIHDFNFGGADLTQILESSNFGVRLSSAINISANNSNFRNGSITSCKRVGIELTRGNMLNLTEIDFEFNGDLIPGFTYGAIIINRPLNDSNPLTAGGNYVSIFNITNCWFERNKGFTIYLPDPTENNIDNVIVNITNSYFAASYEEESYGVYLGLNSLPVDESPSYIGKVNIYGTASKLWIFEVKARETICTGSSIDNFIVNNTSPIFIGTPAFVFNKNYLLEN